MHIPQLIFGNLESCRKNTHFFSHQHCSGIILAEYYFSSEIKLIKLTGFLAMSNNFSTGLSLATFQKIMSACFIHPNQCERWCVLHGKVFDVIFKWKLYGICMLLAMRIVPNYIHNIPGFLWFAMKRLWNVFVAHTDKVKTSAFLFITNKLFATYNRTFFFQTEASYGHQLYTWPVFFYLKAVITLSCTWHLVTKFNDSSLRGNITHTQVQYW